MAATVEAVDEWVAWLAVTLPAMVSMNHMGAVNTGRGAEDEEE